MLETACIETRGIILSRQRTTKALIRLHRYERLICAFVVRIWQKKRVFSWRGWNDVAQRNQTQTAYSAIGHKTASYPEFFILFEKEPLRLGLLSSGTFKVSTLPARRFFCKLESLTDFFISIVLIIFFSRLNFITFYHGVILIQESELSKTKCISKTTVYRYYYFLTISSLNSFIKTLWMMKS